MPKSFKGNSEPGKYVEDLQRCAGPEEAKLFVKQLHRNVPLAPWRTAFQPLVHLFTTYFAICLKGKPHGSACRST